MCSRAAKLLLLLPVYGSAFAGNSPWKDVLSTIIVPFISSQPNRVDKKTDDDRDGGASVLASLDLKSSTEPKLWDVSPRWRTKLLSAVIIPIIRAGSGGFAEGYTVSVIDKDDSQYSIFQVGDKQILESSEVSPNKRRQDEPLILYEFEGSPSCRKVREAVSMLSLTVTFLPCPRGGLRSRRDFKSKYGNKATFPLLVDPNTGITLKDEDAIIQYLFKTYGSGTVPWTLAQGNLLVTVTAAIGLIVRPGSKARPSNPPQEPILLWSYELSPVCKAVKETLCELEIPHTQISCPRGSTNRQDLFERKKRFQLPYIEDPNTGVSLFESEAIVEYLEKMYGLDLPTSVKFL